MSALRPTRWGSRAQDSGYTMVELVVAMGIFSVLLAVFAVTIENFTRATIVSVQTSDQSTQARTIFNLFDKQVRSSSAINRPVLVGGNWYVEFRTDAISPSTCTQWVLRTSTQTLAVRTWTTGVTAVSTPGSWRTLATDVSSTGQPFTFTAGTTEVPNQQLAIDLRYRKGTGPVTSSRSTFTAQNTNVSTVTNADVNADGVSDTQVCRDISNARPA